VHPSAPAPAAAAEVDDDGRGGPKAASSSALLLALSLAAAALALVGVGGWRALRRRGAEALALKDASQCGEGGVEMSSVEPETEASLEAMMSAQHLDVDARAAYLKRVQSAKAMSTENEPHYFSNPMMKGLRTEAAADAPGDESAVRDGNGVRFGVRLAAQSRFKDTSTRGAVASKPSKAAALAAEDAAAKAGAGGFGSGEQRRGPVRRSVQAMFGADGRELNFQDVVATSATGSDAARARAMSRYTKKMSSLSLWAAGKGAASSLAAQDGAAKRAARPASGGDVDDEGDDDDVTNVFDLDAELGEDKGDERPRAAVGAVASAPSVAAAYGQDGAAAYGQDGAAAKGHADAAARAGTKFWQKLQARADTGDPVAQAKLQEAAGGLRTRLVPPKAAAAPPAALNGGGWNGTEGVELDDLLAGAPGAAASFVELLGAETAEIATGAPARGASGKTKGPVFTDL
jgi:hypothetical protein